MLNATHKTCSGRHTQRSRQCLWELPEFSKTIRTAHCGEYCIVRLTPTAIIVLKKPIKRFILSYHTVSSSMNSLIWKSFFSIEFIYENQNFWTWHSAISNNFPTIIQLSTLYERWNVWIYFRLVSRLHLGRNGTRAISCKYSIWCRNLVTKLIIKYLVSLQSIDSACQIETKVIKITTDGSMVLKCDSMPIYFSFD